MRFTIIALAAFAGLALGQTQGGINLPTCANKCVSDFVSGSKLGTCELINIKCICENDAFLDSIACCLAERCEPEDQVKAATEALNFCKINAGATGLPTAVTCATLAAKTSSASSTASTTPTPTPNAAIQNMGDLGVGVLGVFVAALL